MRIIIIYNASGTVAGELSYITKKLLNISSCAACDITHSFKELGEKKEFINCRLNSSIPIEKLHCNKLFPQLSAFITESKSLLPLVVLEKKDMSFAVLLNDLELKSMNGSVEMFENKLNLKLKEFGVEE